MGMFDDAQGVLMSTTEKVFGVLATWVSSLSGSTFSGNVLFSSPNNKILIGDTNKFQYRPYDYFFEYFTGQFDGLKELTDSGNIQTVTINGLSLYVREVYTKDDGKTYIAFCEKQ